MPRRPKHEEEEEEEDEELEDLEGDEEEEEEEEDEDSDADLRPLEKDELPKVEPYKVLGIDKTATADEIKLAYRKAALKNHPGTNILFHLSLLESTGHGGPHCSNLSSRLADSWLSLRLHSC
jgi:DnaJ domain